MPQVNITIDLSDVVERLEELIGAILDFLKIGLERFVLPRLKEIIPVRTGRLRTARVFVPTAGGGYFGWTPRGFYWRFQPGLHEESQRIVRSALPSLISWAVRQARAKVRI